MNRLLFVSVFLSATVSAHEVQVAVGSAVATVLQINYADGQPFAFEAYELYPQGGEVPAQVGRTDARGRVSFVAGQGETYRLKAWSADGHGVEQLVVSVGGDGVVNVAPSSNRTPLLLAGAGGIFGLFGLWQLFLRRRSGR